MANERGRASRARARELVFGPLAWLKLQYFCHHGDTEIGGFAVTSENEPLYVEEFHTVGQRATSVTVEFADDAVADYFDTMTDRGLPPAQYGRVWCHTHPGSSATPSGTDEDTFAGVFGHCDWSLMFILARSSQTYARLAFSAGPRGALELPVRVDWSAWPECAPQLPRMLLEWRDEYDRNIQVAVDTSPVFSQEPHDGLRPGLDDQPWWDVLPWDDRLDSLHYFPTELLDELEALPCLVLDS